jgi:hypothetical protein
MKISIYLDGISNIVMIDGVVRFDLVTLAKASQSEQKDVVPAVEKVASAATTLPGFLRIHEQISKVVKDMIDQGLIKINPPADNASPLAKEDKK